MSVTSTRILSPTLHDVLDLADPLAVAQLADVHQAVLAGHQRDEGAEGGGLDDRAQEPLADLRQLRVGDRVDHADRLLRGGAVGGTDVDRAVVLDRDVGTGLLGDRVDHLALRADDLADLVDGHLDRGDPRRVGAHLVRPVDRLADHLEDGQPGVAGLGQRGGEHLGRDAVELGVELQRGDELGGAGDLEVHVAERVFGAEDVGQRDVARGAVDLVGHQAHRDARDRRLQRHTGVEQRHRRRADRAHRRRAVACPAPRTPAGSRTGTPRASAARAGAPARPARRGRSRGASASRPGPSHRSSTAGSCSGAGSACGSPGRAGRSAAPCAACSAW